MVGPVRVAQVVAKMGGGGVEAVVMNYYRHVDRRRVQFDFVVDSDSTMVPRGEIEGLGGRVVEVPPYQRQPANSRALEGVFRAGGWPVVHAHMNALSVLPLRAASRAGVPVRVAHSHSTWGRGEPARNVLKAALRTQANRYPTHRVACGTRAGEWLFGRGADFAVVPNAIDLDRFRFDAGAREALRAGLGAGGSTLVVGHVGRFMAQKNHGFLLEAFARLRAARPDSLLVLAGDGAGRAAAERRALALGVAGAVRFLGHVPDPSGLYSAMDAFLLPSRYEGLCVVGIEAQRAGLGCVFSDRVTREADVTGTVTFLPIRDPGAWAEALRGWEVGARVEAPEGSFDAYDIRTQAEALAAFYEGALAGLG